MLVFHDMFRFQSKCYALWLSLISVAIIPLHAGDPGNAESIWYGEHLPRAEPNQVTTYFQGINDETTLEEATSFIVSLHAHLRLSGFKIPPIHDLIWEYRLALIEQDIYIEDNEFAMLYEAVIDREREMAYSYIQYSHKCDLLRPSVHLVKHKEEKKHKKKDIKLSGKTLFGFIKFVAGSLLCIIPHPITLTAGGALAGIGINEMIDGARERGDENELDMLRRRQNEGQKP